MEHNARFARTLVLLVGALSCGGKVVVEDSGGEIDDQRQAFECAVAQRPCPSALNSLSAVVRTTCESAPGLEHVAACDVDGCECSLNGRLVEECTGIRCEGEPIHDCCSQKLMDRFCDKCDERRRDGRR